MERLSPTRLQTLRGHAVRYFRNERGLTQAHVARLANVGVATLGRLEARGPRSPTIYAKVCRVMMVSPREIDGWIAARTLDARLWPLVLWFSRLTPKEQDCVGVLLKLLPLATMVAGIGE